MLARRGASSSAAGAADPSSLPAGNTAASGNPAGSGNAVVSGHLASVATQDDLALLLSFLAQLPAARGAPAFAGTPTGTWGLWVGLAGAGTDLSAALAAPPSRDPAPPPFDPSVPLQWTDGAAASLGPGAMLLQQAWALGQDGSIAGAPVASPYRSCMYLSNRSTLLGPGLTLAPDCAWRLPFVCKTVLPNPFAPPPPPPPSSPSAAGPTPDASPSPSPSTPPPTPQLAQVPAVTPLAAAPTLVQLDGQGLAWVPSPSDFSLASSVASSHMCEPWGGTLVTFPSAAVQSQLVAVLDQAQVRGGCMVRCRKHTQND